ncbi:MAG: patatin-like phospholipase family protein [Parcubacteria group bacterium]
MKDKLAIITSSGGMKCSYSAGVLCAMAKIYNLRNPDILVGSSGSTGSLAYYLTGQYDSIQNIWTNLLTSPLFISLSRVFKIMDIDYLVDTVFKQQDALDVEKIHKSKSRLFISATEYQTGKPKFFTNTDNIFEALRASKAIPVITGKKVIIDNVEYIDGSFGASLNINIEKAIKEGARNIIIINDKGGEMAFATKAFYILYSFFTNKNIRKLLRRHCEPNHHLINPQKNINMIIISPSRKLQIHSLDNKKQHLEESFSLGYEDLKNNQDFKIFFAQL